MGSLAFYHIYASFLKFQMIHKACLTYLVDVQKVYFLKKNFYAKIYAIKIFREHEKSHVDPLGLRFRKIFRLFE